MFFLLTTEGAKEKRIKKKSAGSKQLTVSAISGRRPEPCELLEKLDQNFKKKRELIIWHLKFYVQ